MLTQSSLPLRITSYNVCYTKLLRSVGQSLAILSGAWQANGQWLVVLDADGQNDPADIPGMLAAVRPEPSRFLLELPQHDLQWENRKPETTAEERQQKAQTGIANLRALLKKG